MVVAAGTRRPVPAAAQEEGAVGETRVGAESLAKATQVGTAILSGVQSGTAQAVAVVKPRLVATATVKPAVEEPGELDYPVTLPARWYGTPVAVAAAGTNRAAQLVKVAVGAGPTMSPARLLAKPIPVAAAAVVPLKSTTAAGQVARALL